jgi:hypothetical protein
MRALDMRNVHDTSQPTEIQEMFSRAAPVRNSTAYLNVGKLSAGDFPSLDGNKRLLGTFSAFFMKLNAYSSTKWSFVNPFRKSAGCGIL